MDKLMQLMLDPLDPLGRVARTVDGGKTWATLALPEGASLVEADPHDPSLLYAGIHDGEAVQVMVSRDDGAHWERP